MSSTLDALANATYMRPASRGNPQIYWVSKQVLNDNIYHGGYDHDIYSSVT